ncbi:MAG: hypothetical protein IJZ85_02430 [Lachnospiraceae bacterium]|nr:hypothetical protein [Lachnospiraceae bacterium]
MRGRQFAASVILVVQMLLLCTACQSAEDAMKDTSGEVVQDTDAADVSGAVDFIGEESKAPETDDAEKKSETAAQTAEHVDAVNKGKTFENVLAVHSADIDHDGENESVVVRVTDKNQYGDPNETIAISVVKKGRIIWECADLWIKQNPLHEMYFLYTAQDGKAYLVYYRQYCTNFYEGSYRYFSLKEVEAASEAGAWQAETWGINSLRVHWEGISYKMDEENVVDYVDDFNKILENSILLCSNSGGKFSYSTEKNPLTYREELKVLFDGQVDYSGCETIEEKVEALNEILLPAPEPGALTYSVELEQIFDRILGENADADGNIPTAETLDKSKWFAGYNGEKLQVINPDKYAGSSMDAFIGTVFYRADEGETPADVAKRMVEAAAEEMTIPSENRSFTITKYLITEQKLLQPDYFGEDIWYFYPAGYFRYDGPGGIMGGFEDYAAYADIMVDGMLPFYSQGSDGAVAFMLMRDGDVYRMQKAGYWGE